MIDPTVGTGVISVATVKGTDVRNIINQLDYFESIYATGASCNLTINDASGFSQNASLKGGKGEEVEVAFGSREGENIRMKFEVAIVGDRIRTGQKQDMFLITCAPPEFIDDNKKSMDEAHKDIKVSDMVKKFHEKYTKDSSTLKKDLVTNEETKDKQSYTGVGMSPTTAIRWAAKEGQSGEAKASNYVFYQDRDGYHFKTVDSMLSSGEDLGTYSYGTQNTGQGDASKSIISFEQKKDADSPQSSENGASSDHWYFYDPYTGKIDGSKDSKRDGAGETSHTGKEKLTQDEETDRGSQVNLIAAPGASLEQSKTIQARDSKVIENKRSLPEHAAQSSAANQLENRIMNVMVPGNTNIKPGKKITLNIPSNQESNEMDSRAGTYLVTSVRHILYKDEKDMKYNCILECKSDSQSQATGG
jgi:hypothetical protein